MSEILLQVLSFALLPVAAMIIGAIVASFRPPGARLRSILQHFAAGVVFSVVAVELLPDVMREHNALAVSIGFALGVAVMLGIKKLSGETAEKAATGENVEPPETGEIVFTAMLFGIGVDILVDGFLLGIGFAAGAKEGKLLAFALGVELLSLGLALASTMTEARTPRLKIILTTVALSLLILVGAGLGGTILQRVSSETLEAILSFGLAALLYLVTEELLTEAHEVPETPLITSSFFAGFLLFLILGMVA
jgi:ZIP family zinc transporter